MASFSTGSNAGPYEIVSQLGKSGMGEVFLARDTRLDRRVALKVLPSHLNHASGVIHRGVKPPT